MGLGNSDRGNPGLFEPRFRARFLSKSALTAVWPCRRIALVTRRTDDEKLLRAAIEAGLRVQQNGFSRTPGSPGSEGVATLQRIKVLLRNRSNNSKSNL